MGGHTHFGEFTTLEKAVKAFRDVRKEYEHELYLHLKYAQIIYDEKDNKYKFAMRFTK